MSSDGLGPDFNRSYLDRASKAARLTAAATWRYSEEPRRDPRARFWRPRLVKATNKQTEREQKTDSKLFDPALQVAPTTSLHFTSNSDPSESVAPPQETGRSSNSEYGSPFTLTPQILSASCSDTGENSDGDEETPGKAQQSSHSQSENNCDKTTHSKT